MWVRFLHLALTLFSLGNCMKENKYNKEEYRYNKENGGIIGIKNIEEE